MKEPRERQIEEIYHAAAELDREERSRLFAKIDPEIRREVESLLAYDSGDGALLPPPAALIAGDAPPTRIGQYLILSKLGEGGMGVVYKAEQERPRRIVALKIIRPGWCTAELQRRFEREAQALGRLHHPGIAQIYEAGTADAGFGPQPYFAMELIHGSPLGKYVEAHRLSTRDKLDLIAKICDAAHHAHQKGIIHRDLKPGNILVDETGQPKILDFGVARITDNDAQVTRQTNLGQIVGTPAYMSPEQVLADPLELDTRSDVYSLGVILYELLSGRLPYDVGKQLPEAIRAIRETDPEPLSTVSREYRGDIETIVAKALDKDKTRRYNSAADLGLDIRRYLDDEPVAARPPSAVYQLQKFARRHRALVGGASTVFVVLLAGIVVSTSQAIRANRASRAALIARDRASAAELETRQERDRALTAEQAATLERNNAVAARSQAIDERNRAIAEKRRADNEAATAEAVRDFLQNDLLAQASALGQSRPGGKPDPDLKVRTALDQAAARIAGKFEARPLVEAAIQQTIASAYKELTLYPQSLRHAERAVQLRRREQSENHPDTLAALSELAELHMRRGSFPDALSLHTNVLEVRRRVLGDDHLQTLKSMDGLGQVLEKMGRYTDAETVHTRALASSRRVRGEGHPDTAVVMGSLALDYTRQGKYALAEPLNVKALDILQRALGHEHPLSLLAKNNLAQVYLRQSKFAQSAELQTEVVAVQRRLLGEEHDQTLISMGNLATIYVQTGKFAEGEVLLAKVASTMRRLLGDEHSSTLSAMNNLAMAYSRQGELSQAEETYALVLEKRRRVLGDKHMLTVYTMHSLAMIRRRQSRYADAEVLLAEAVDSQRRSPGVEVIDTLEDMILLAEVRVLQQKYDVSLLREAVSILERQRSENWILHYGRSLLGTSLAAQRQYQDAEKLLLAGYEELDRRKSAIPASGQSAPERTVAWLVQLYREWGKPDQANEWQTRLDSIASTAAK